MDTPLHGISTFGPYRFSTCLDMDNPARTRLFHLFDKPPGTATGVLSGRQAPVLADIPGVGHVVAKHYRRGGFIRHFMKYRYLNIGIPRPQREYRMMETARSLGVSSPQPLAWAIRGRLFYKGFLVTRRIDEHCSLSELGAGDAVRCRAAVEKVAGQIRLLIDNGIFHVDLHPGNVLMDKRGRVYIIDFDKARRVPWRPEKLQAAYVRRWKRAVEKYSLPTTMTDQLISSLGAPI